MRAVHWLFVISVALFVSGIGFVIAAERTVQRTPPQANAPVLTAVATVAEIMSDLVDPAANAVFKAVGTIVSAQSVEEFAPKNDEEWTALGARATMLAESGNLLMMEGRAVDGGDWITMSRALLDAGAVAAKAAAAKDAKGIYESGAAIYTTCENCHVRYWRQ